MGLIKILTGYERKQQLCKQIAERYGRLHEQMQALAPQAPGYVVNSFVDAAANGTRATYKLKHRMSLSILASRAEEKWEVWTNGFSKRQDLYGALSGSALLHIMDSSTLEKALEDVPTIENIISKFFSAAVFGTFWHDEN